MPVELRPYQLDVIERGAAQLRRGVKRLIIQAPTGAGKTHISSEIMRRGVAKGKRWLFLAARRRLIEQKSARLDLFGVPHSVFMAGHRPDLRQPVMVASRDTILSRCVRNNWMDLPDFDGIMIDECHGCTGKEYQALLDRWPHAHKIGLTATPTTGDGFGLGKWFDAIECTVPVSQLIREGYIVPLKVYAPDRKGYKCQKGLRGNPVSHWQRLAEGRPTVLFAANRLASRDVVAQFNAAGIAAAHIDAHTSDQDRDQVIRQIRAGFLQVVSNVGIWTEGVDISELSCCILYRVCGSYITYAQAVGRVMRPCEGKRDAILIDHAGACTRHGFCDEDIEWTLDAGDSIDARNKKARKAGSRATPITCPKCSIVFSGSITCPACGHALPARMRPPSGRRDEILTEASRERDPAQRREEQVRYWHTCLRVMACKGLTYAAASQMYRRHWREWPGADFPNTADRSLYYQPVSTLFPQYTPRPKDVA
jgi:superfamily II DNA or RNA helicase